MKRSKEKYKEQFLSGILFEQKLREYNKLLFNLLDPQVVEDHYTFTEHEVSSSNIFVKALEDGGLKKRRTIYRGCAFLAPEVEELSHLRRRYFNYPEPEIIEEAIELIIKLENLIEETEDE